MVRVSTFGFKRLNIKRSAIVTGSGCDGQTDLITVGNNLVSVYT